MSKLVKASLVDQIFDYLQKGIIDREWKPGDKLPSETDLANQLGVSRMSVRNAIQKLCALGLTETRTGEGTFVREFNLTSYFAELYRIGLIGSKPNDINDLRAILQIGSARLAIESNLTEKALTELDQLNEKMIAATKKDDLEAFQEADLAFHRAICGLCDNDLLFMLYDAIQALLEDMTRKNVQRSISESGDYHNVLAHHQELLDSLHNNDIDSFIRAIMESRERSHSYYAKKKMPEEESPDMYYI